MPRQPRTSPAISGIRASAFSTLADRLARCEGERFLFHVGDTWMNAPDGCRMQDLLDASRPGLNRYAPPRGLPELLEAVAERVTRRSGVATGPEAILISAGATGGLDAACGAVLDPGDEVLIVAPYWPLIDGIVRAHRGCPVAVPLIGEASTAGEAVEAVEKARTDRTAALYVSTPNNPTGQVLPRAWLAALASWARDRGLWILSDEVYEDYLYGGDEEHVYVRSLAPERTFSAHSFSKAFGMAGYRIGYVAGPPEAMDDLTKVSTHAFYSAPTPSQVAALRALDGRGDRWVEQARASYAEVGTAAASMLDVPAPRGSTFLFLDVRPALDDRGLRGFLEDAADRGLCLAPGPSFGPYPGHVRVCFTAQPPDVVLRGIERLASVLALRRPTGGA